MCAVADDDDGGPFCPAPSIDIDRVRIGISPGLGLNSDRPKPMDESMRAVFSETFPALFDASRVDINHGPDLDLKGLGGAYFTFVRRFFMEHITSGGAAASHVEKAVLARDSARAAVDRCALLRLLQNGCHISHSAALHSFNSGTYATTMYGFFLSRRPCLFHTTPASAP